MIATPGAARAEVELGRRLARAIGEREKHRCGRLAAQQSGDQLSRRRIAPVQIVEHEDQRPRVGERLEQTANRAMRRVSRVGAGGGGPVAAATEGRQKAGEVREQSLVQRSVGVQLLRRHVGVERVDPDAEREITFELRPGAREDEMAALLGTATQLGQQERLADAGVAFDRKSHRATPVEAVQSLPEPNQLRRAPDRLHGAHRHRLSSIPLRGTGSGGGFRGRPRCSTGRQRSSLSSHLERQ